MIEVSVIIVNWNAKQHLLNCLSSLSDQSIVVGEIIVIDNGSSDSSCNAVETQFPQVKLIKNGENLGFARANNIGIGASAGRFLCLVNSDVILKGNCIENLMEFMDRNRNVGLAGPRLLNPNGTLQYNCRHFPGIWNNLCQALGLNSLFPKWAFFSEPFMKYWPHDEVRQVDVITGSFWIIRHEALEEVGLLDEDFFFYGEDVDWCKRFHKAKWDVAFCPHAEAIHYGGGSSRNAPVRFYIELQKADLRYWRKHHGLAGKLCYQAIILLRQFSRLIYGLIKYIIIPSQRKEIGYKIKRSFVSICWVICH